jgi:hypothetical protein
MNAAIARMTARQKKVARHSLDAFAVLMVALGIWLASGAYEVKPVITHTNNAPVIMEDAGVRI